MKKRTVSLVLAACMALSLAACGSSDQGSTTAANGGEATTAANGADSTTSANSGNTELSGEITFVAWGSDAELECDEEAVQAFMAAYPGTTVKFEALNDSYQTTVETRFIGGQSPDVIYGHPQTLLSWMKEGMLMPISDVYENHPELWDEEVYSTNLYDAYYFNGEYYATPVGADTTVLFYNKDMWDAEGLDYPTAETTWEELAEMCAKLTKRDADGVPTQIGMDGMTGYWMNMLYSKGGKVLDDMNSPTKVVFESPEALEVLNFINDNYDETSGYYANESDWTYLAGGFSGGEIGCFMSGVYDIVWLSQVEGINWDIAPIPETMKEEGDTPVLYAGYSVSSQTQNEALAKEFVYFMTQYEAQKIMAKTGLITPLRKDVAYSDEVLKYDGAPENHALRVDNLPYSQNSQGQVLCWWEMNDAVNNGIYQMVNGELTPEEAMKQIQQQCEDLLANELAN